MITRRHANLALLSTAVLTATHGLAAAQDLQAIELPPPRKEGGKPLMQAVLARRSIRDYSDRPLPPQVLSDLLWAAFGINRPPERRPHGAFLAAFDRDGDLCGDGGRHLAL